MQIINAATKGLMNNLINEKFNHMMTPNTAAAVAAYLNPGHQTNWRDAMPLPDGSQGAVYLVKDCWTKTIVIPAGQTQITFYNYPFFEVPFGYYSEGFFRGLYAPSMVEGGTSASFCVNNHIYAHRCLGKSMTIVPTTSVLNLKGSVTMGRKPADVDFETRSFAVGAAVDNVNRPIMQRLPNDGQSVSALGNMDNFKTQEGAYIISHHSNHNWNVRDDPTHKTYPHAVSTVNGNTGIKVTGPDGGAAVDLYEEGGINVCHAANVDGMDIPMAHFSGLAAGDSFSIKCAMVYECQLKASSRLTRYVTPRPLFDPSLMDALFAFECQLDKNGLFPASYNFWDKVWSGFKKFWGAGGGNAIRVLGDAALPGAGTALSTVGGVATSLF